MLSDEEFASLGFTFIWRIENFSHCFQRQNEYIMSPIFVMNSSGGETAWYLEMTPREYDVDNITYRLCKDGRVRTNVFYLDYEISILAADGSLQESIECEAFRSQERNAVGEGKHVAHEMFRQKKDLYLPQDTLTLYCRMWESGNVHKWLGQSLARTCIGVEKTSIIWPIEAFQTLKLNDKKSLIVSSLKEKLSLILYFEPGIPFDANTRIEILQTNTIIQENLTSCKISVVDSQGSLVLSKEDDHFFENSEDQQIWNFPFSIRKSLLLKNKDLYLSNDTLRLQFDFAISIGVIYSELEHSELGPYASPHVNKFLINIPRKPVFNSLKEDLKSLHAEKTLCDFSMIVESETFSVHKAVLAARSSVFRTMISTDMLEKKTNQVVIPDMDSDTVKQMLLFMYTNTIEDQQWEHISKLYSAADKYGILSLKQECSSILVSNMCTENVCVILELGDMHHDNYLKDAAVDFLFRNYEKILLSDEWQKLMEHNSQLAAKTMHSMYLKKIRNLNGKSDT